MNSNIQILLAVTAVASGSFLQTPSNQLESTFNTTFLTTNGRLFKPIIIPNITKFSETSHQVQKTKSNEKILKSILHPEDSPQDSTDDESKTTGNPLKFSSRYSTKQSERTTEDEKDVSTTEVPTEAESSKNEETPKLISNRSDNLDSEESKKDIEEYSEESDESEPKTESPNSTSYRNYVDKDPENEETSATEETDSSEEKEETEDKRSVEDYYNSGSKNYHSIQTPLDRIKYQGPHFFRGDRKRIVGPIARHRATHNWPYSKSQIKAELENLNEISGSDENYEKELDEGINEEVKINPKHLGLESAEEKDRTKFDLNKKYNYIELRNQRKQQQKALIAEEEKDDQKPLFQSLKQYQVDEEEPKGKSIFNFKNNENIWVTKRPSITTPKDNFRTPPTRKIKIYPVKKQTANFQGHQFLGPVVFNQNLDLQKSKPQKEATRNIFLKGLIENEKIDQENLTNQRFQKSVLRTGSKESQSFNHLKESDEMYNAILANIQSVFGLRTQPLKSGARSQKGSVPEVDFDETKALTWSFIKNK